MTSVDHSAEPLRLGLPMWSHRQWQHLFPVHAETALGSYASVFNSVEGNTTFYAVPERQVAAAWARAVPEEFRFTFKLPSRITHQLQLQNCRQELTEFFSAMEPVMPFTQLWKIQLPAAFGPSQLNHLSCFIRAMPAGLRFAVEVRHPAFFRKEREEIQLNRLLRDSDTDRIIMDSRPVFAAAPDTDAVREAHVRKPRVPVHALATSTFPVVRFIAHPEQSVSLTYFRPWLPVLFRWLREGRYPLLFIHTPDNIAAPQLALLLYSRLQAYCSAQSEPLILRDFPDLAEQDQLGLEF